MKNINIRSSKNLKPMDPQLKQQSQLRMKIKILQQQNAMLQKSNLNIFIPISEHHVHQNVDYQSIINKLKQQILALEQENQNQKLIIKKQEREKQEIKMKYCKEIEGLQAKIKELENVNSELGQELQELRGQYEEKVKQCQQLDRIIIQKNVQLKFIHEDLVQEKRKRAGVESQLKDLQRKVSEVIYSSRIYKSQEIKCICIEKLQYDSLKDKIVELEAKIRAMIEASKRQKISLGTRKNDIGEEIVRLKKNIDLQLGIQGNSKHSQQFLKIYKGTNELFNELIKKCQA